MNSVTSSNFFLRLWCTSTPFYPKRAIYSVHLNDASVGDFLKRSSFFTDENQKVVLTCLRLETRSKIYYFWSFTMHSITSSSSFSRPWCTSTPLFSKRARLSVPLWFILGGFFEKKQLFHRWDQKSGFNMSTFRDRFQQLLLLKYHHALIIFINFIFPALVHFYSVRL